MGIMMLLVLVFSVGTVMVISALFSKPDKAIKRKIIIIGFAMICASTVFIVFLIHMLIPQM